MKKVYFKIGYFHPEDFAISAITLSVQGVLGKDTNCTVHGLVKTAGRKLSALVA